MFNFFGKDRTSRGFTHLCKSCSKGQWVNGYRESEKLVICTSTTPNLIVPFAVHECSEYRDKHKPVWGEMGTLEVDVQPSRGPSKISKFMETNPQYSVKMGYEEWDENGDRDHVVRVQ